ncbi:FecR family protein [Proteiniphilum sp. X52]|uniref:FecR family protein n=1 Tax=Proteiniphilum sp. X52 TaxID=2382159 RepID=UPI000F0A7400|nr:FecR family protein [Proteiniphilum sp. X52]RNC63535.1 FecR family protein [Proteiniphilum sp. X52]
MDYKDFLCDDLFVYWRIHPTRELNSFWDSFIRENEEYKEAFNKAIETFDAIRSQQDPFQIEDTSVLLKLKNRIKKEKKRKSNIILTSSAAAVLLLMIISTLFIFREKPEETDLRMSSIGEVMSNNNIQLFTGNEVLEIDNNSTLNLSEKKHSAVIRNPLTKQEINLNDNRTNTLLVPYGKRSTMILADGSKVHLNSGTKMEFPTTFSGKKREINVEGEIFIEVAKQNNTPFVIHTPHSQITVHGTSFNVSSYSEDRRESVVLVNGSVEVKSKKSTLLLNPNEMAEIENGQIMRKEVDVSDYIGWTRGYMQFNKSPLNEVLKKIGRYYNIEFQFASDLNMHNQSCSGKLFLSENLNDVLEAFSKMTYYHYDKQSDKAIFIHK